MNEAALNKLMRDLINTIIEPDYAIRAQQTDALRPAKPYATVQTLTIQRVGTEQYSYANNGNDDMDTLLQGSRNIVLSLNFFRTNAIDNACKVRIALMRDNILETFRLENVGLLERSEVRNLTQTLDDIWEERAQFDVTLNYVENDTDLVPVINSAQVGFKYQENLIEYINTYIKVANT